LFEAPLPQSATNAAPAGATNEVTNTTSQAGTTNAATNAPLTKFE
jgi:hypothetical protein